MGMFNQRALGLVVGICVGVVSTNAYADAHVVPGQYIIQRKRAFASSGSVAIVAQAVSERAYEVRHAGATFEVVAPRSASVRGAQALSDSAPLDWSVVRQDCEEIKKDTSIEVCEPDLIRRLYVTPNDPGFSVQWGLQERVSSGGSDAIGAWNVGTGSAGAIIGVIDSGVYKQHPDLVENLWTNSNEPIDGIDNDGNGYVDDAQGINSFTGSANFGDCNGHGTHVAGIIAARGNNGLGVTGVNWVASVLAVNTDRDCGGSTSASSIVAAYDYLYRLKQRGHPVRVINASFGGEGYLDSEFQAIRRLGSVDILLVAAAGNDGRDLDAFPSYPASYDLPNIITVGATGQGLAPASYSNFGQSVDIAAPGGDFQAGDSGIVSTFSPDAEAGVLYKSLQGTSMATPMVTGALALLASLRTNLVGSELRQLLLNSAANIPGLNSSVAGGRFLDVAALVNAPNPEDQCPSDSNKLAPGMCGCGVVDSYADSDEDLSLDCVDGCPVDGAKTAAGICGCGVSDGDANGNGQADCLDPDLSGITPGRPSVVLSKSRLVIGMSERAGVEYLIEVSVTKPSSGSKAQRPRVNFYTSASAAGVIRKPVRGSLVRVRYAYKVIGSTNGASRWSPAVRLRISR